jgi:hypothetical protein
MGQARLSDVFRGVTIHVNGYTVGGPSCLGGWAAGRLVYAGPLSLKQYIHLKHPPPSTPLSFHFAIRNRSPPTRSSSS